MQKLFIFVLVLAAAAAAATNQHDTLDAKLVKPGQLVFSVPDSKPHALLWTLPAEAPIFLEASFKRYLAGETGPEDGPADLATCVPHVWERDDGTTLEASFVVDWLHRKRHLCKPKTASVEAEVTETAQLEGAGHYVDVHQARVEWTYLTSAEGGETTHRLPAEAARLVEEAYANHINHGGNAESACEDIDETRSVMVDFSTMTLTECGPDRITHPARRVIEWDLLVEHPSQAYHTAEGKPLPHNLWWFYPVVVFFILILIGCCVLACGKILEGRRKQQQKRQPEMYAVMHEDLMPGLIVIQHPEQAV